LATAKRLNVATHHYRGRGFTERLSNGFAHPGEIRFERGGRLERGYFGGEFIFMPSGYKMAGTGCGA